MWSRIALTVLAAGLLSALSPSPAAALAGLRSAQWSAADPTGPLVAVVALIAWACGLWLLLVAALCLAEQLPGRYGELAAWFGRAVAPHAVRRLVAVSLGATVVLGTAGPAAAMSGDDHGTAAGRGTATLELGASDGDPGPQLQLDWPVTPPGAPAVPPPVIAPTPGPAPTTQAPPAASQRERPVSPAEQADRSGSAVVVRAGDCLWSLAAADLGSTATDRQIAAAWPSWWAANREVIGDDPDLIHPGMRLTRPTAP